MEGWKNGGMEKWKGGKVEGWRNGTPPTEEFNVLDIHEMLGFTYGSTQPTNKLQKKI